MIALWSNKSSFWGPFYSLTLLNLLSIHLTLVTLVYILTLNIISFPLALYIYLYVEHFSSGSIQKGLNISITTLYTTYKRLYDGLSISPSQSCHSTPCVCNSVHVYIVSILQVPPQQIISVNPLPHTTQSISLLFYSPFIIDIISKCRKCRIILFIPIWTFTQSGFHCISINDKLMNDSLLMNGGLGGVTFHFTCISLYTCTHFYTGHLDPPSIFEQMGLLLNTL